MKLPFTKTQFLTLLFFVSKNKIGVDASPPTPPIIMKGLGNTEKIIVISKDGNVTINTVGVQETAPV